MAGMLVEFSVKSIYIEKATSSGYTFTPLLRMKNVGRWIDWKRDKWFEINDI